MKYSADILDKICTVQIIIIDVPTNDAVKITYVQNDCAPECHVLRLTYLCQCFNFQLGTNII